MAEKLELTTDVLADWERTTADKLLRWRTAQADRSYEPKVWVDLALEQAERVEALIAEVRWLREQAITAMAHLGPMKWSEAEARLDLHRRLVQTRNGEQANG